VSKLKTRRKLQDQSWQLFIHSLMTVLEVRAGKGLRRRGSNIDTHLLWDISAVCARGPALVFAPVACQRIPG
jgi:hypothetical protein